jgi:hypothetical protein
VPAELLDVSDRLEPVGLARGAELGTVGPLVDVDTFFYQTVGARGLTSATLHHDVTRDIWGGHAVFADVDTAYLPNWSRSLGHSIVGYDDSAARARTSTPAAIGVTARRSRPTAASGTSRRAGLAGLSGA